MPHDWFKAQLNDLRSSAAAWKGKLYALVRTKQGFNRNQSIIEFVGFTREATDDLDQTHRLESYGSAHGLDTIIPYLVEKS